MEIYVITFLISSLFFSIYEKCNSKTIKRIFLIVAILLPCFLAGMRDVSIGADTSGYVSTLFDTAHQSNNIFEYYNSTFYYEWHSEPVINFDFAYTLLAYACAKIFGTFSSFLFFSELLTILPIVAALILYKRYFNINLTLSVLMFYFLYYNTTFNAVRQWLSIGFAFLAVAHLCTDKRKHKIFRYAFIAPFFHKSGLIGILLIIFYWLINRIRGKNVRIGNLIIKKDNVKVIEIIILSIVLLLSMSALIVPILSGVGLGRYIGYVSSNITFSINQLLYQIPFVVIIILERRLLFESTESRNVLVRHFELFSLCIFFVNLVLSQLATVMENSWRVTLLVGLFNIVLFPYLIKKENDKTKRMFYVLVLILYLVLYWFFTFVITGRHGTVPYVFAK